uniref:Uncharacterized protein n=1 Tax=Meloidogyne floridensis TaxID=298350 RepID=A0A915NU49_9BILA
MDSSTSSSTHDSSGSSTEHTIDGPLRLGQLIDNLEIELASRHWNKRTHVLWLLVARPLNDPFRLDNGK